MKITSPSPFALLLAAAFAVSCAAAADDTGIGTDVDSGGTGLDAKNDTGGSTDSTSSTDTFSGTDTGTPTETGGVCTSHCTSDFDCSSTCSSPPSGSFNCCDTATGVCYVHAGSCPTPTADTGVDTAPY